MNTELTFRISLAVIGLPIYAIRYYYLSLMDKSGDKISNRASQTTVILVWLVSVLATFVPVAYVIAPRWLVWAALPLPTGLRWLGAALGILSIPLLLWIHRTLGRNFNLPDVI
jgi:protein-S-isoprenylcysteine O-methyltransferase Ste14